MGYSSFALGPCLAEGVLCFELCEQRLTPPMSDSLFRLAGIKRCIFSVFLLGFRTFYPLHVHQPHKTIPGDLSDPSLIETKHTFSPPTGCRKIQTFTLGFWFRVVPKGLNV